MDGVDPLLEGGDHPQRVIALSGVFRRFLEVDTLDQNRLWDQRRRRLQGYCIRNNGRSEHRLRWLLWLWLWLWLATGGLFWQRLDFGGLDQNRLWDQRRRSFPGNGRESRRSG
jgi:hypothetical protein